MNSNSSSPPSEKTRRCLFCDVTYRKLVILSKAIQIVAALLLLAEVILRFVYFLLLGSLSNYILTFYFLVLSVYLIGFELGIKYLKVKFYLMNFAWGKAAIDFFIGSLVVASWVIPAMDVIILIFFLLAVITLASISYLFKEEEQARVESELKQLEEYREKERQEREDNALEAAAAARK